MAVRIEEEDACCRAEPEAGGLGGCLPLQYL